MRIALITPLAPEKSGVATVVELVLQKLNQQSEMDVDIFTRDKHSVSDVYVKKNYRIYNYTDYQDERIRSQYHLSVFHMGNNYDFHKEISDLFLEYGGIIELHDIALYDFKYGQVAEKGNWEKFYEEMEQYHGIPKDVARNLQEKGYQLEPHKIDCLHFHFLKPYLDRAQCVIVHSDFARQFIHGIDPNIPVEIIPLAVPISAKEQAKKDVKRDDSIFKIGCFGYASAHKQIKVVLNAVSEVLAAGKPIHLYIVGSCEKWIEQYVQEKGISQFVTITGWINIQAFREYLQEMDLVANLRYPTFGESSASLHEALAYGKAVVVSDVGSFSEYDTFQVKRIPVEPCRASMELAQIIQHDMNNLEELHRQEPFRIKLAEKRFGEEVIAKQYRDFLMNFYHTHAVTHRWIDDFVDTICNMSLHTDWYANHVCNDVLFKNIEL